MMYVDGPLSSNCGACGVDLTDAWHTAECPTLGEGWSTRVNKVVEMVNVTAHLLASVDACMPHIKNEDLHAAFAKIRVWASEENTRLNKELHDLFPFHQERKTA